MISRERNIITDKLVVEKTGRTIEEWFMLLDKSGAKKMNHIDIFKLIGGIKELKTLGQWNQNLLTTTYEWDRGLKERGQKEDGFEISVSKTIDTDLSTLYKLFSDEKLRSKWLLEKKIKMRKTTANKSLVITWPDDTTVRVELYKKSDNKSQVVIQQMQIPDSKTAERMKEFWKERLEFLKEYSGK